MINKIWKKTTYNKEPIFFIEYVQNFQIKKYIQECDREINRN